MHTEYQKKIKQLLEPKFVAQLISKEAPEFATKNPLNDLTITPIKHNIGASYHNVVARYDSPSLKDKPIFCSSSSAQNRQNALSALEFIKKNGFKNTDIFVPEPIMFDKKRNAFFYQGIEGENLLRYINKRADISDYMAQAAQWIALLHQISIKHAGHLSKSNARIETVVPGPNKFLPKIEKKFPQYFKTVQDIFTELTDWERINLEQKDNYAIIHGDFHPENIIINKTDGKVSVIDFTDVCVADWARDVANFIQQFGFMSLGKLSIEEIKKYQNIFLKSYFSARKIAPNKDIEKRLKHYQSWTALRSAIYFLIKAPAEPESARTVLNEARELIT